MPEIKIDSLILAEIRREAKIAKLSPDEFARNALASYISQQRQLRGEEDGRLVIEAGGYFVENFQDASNPST
jgi:hypothetical protein